MDTNHACDRAPRPAPARSFLSHQNLRSATRRPAMPDPPRRTPPSS